MLPNRKVKNGHPLAEGGSIMPGRTHTERKGAACITVSTVLISMAGCSSGVTESPQKTTDVSRSVQAEIINKVNERLGVTNHQIVALEIGDLEGEQIQVSVPLEGTQRTLALTPYTNRAKSYKLFVQVENGDVVEVEPGPLRTLRGTVVGLEDAVVAATIGEGGFQARVFMPDATQYWIQPLQAVVEDDVPADYHIVHNAQDMMETDHIDVVLSAESDGIDGGRGHAKVVGAGCVGAMCTAELACDADFEFYQHWGSVAAVEERINTVINAMNIQFERDVAVTHAISAIVVRTTASDPYDTTDAGDMLVEFRSEWLDNFPTVPRDVAQLFTGKNIQNNGNGSVIGIAWLSSVCTSIGFSIVEQFGSSLGFATDLSAHELGHSWSANHCSCANPHYTMNSYLTGANEFHPSHSVPEILAFRDSRTCLSSSFDCLQDSECDDGDTCNGFESCIEGVCVAGIPIDCADGDSCTLDTCLQDGTCLNDPLDCDDEDACTEDTCSEILGCVHVLRDCDDDDACTVDSCDQDSGACINSGGDCNDGNACTIDECDPDLGCVHSPVDCDDGDACTWDNCGPISGCWHRPIDCNGGDACMDYGCDSATGCWSEPVESCCGDGICDDGESACGCAMDCGPPDDVELTCTDEVDNDCDGLLDCEDPDCSDNESCVVPCIRTHRSETGKLCSDGLDNDCDGLVDMDDPNCRFSLTPSTVP